MKKNLMLPILALALDVSAPLIYWFGFMLWDELWRVSHLFSMIGTLMAILAFFMPVAGLIIGIISLASKGKSKLSLAFSISAILIPLIALAVIIILLSTNVIIISLM